jgi:hypothetical protein
MRRPILLTLALAIAMAAPAAFSKENLPEIKPKHEGDITYVCGGVDPLERKAIKKVAERYQVQLSFTKEGSTEPLAGVKVTMVDYKGDKALEVACEGPIFFANPPAGRWTIEVELNGEKMSRTLDVNGRFYVTFDFRFKGSTSN